MIFGLSKRSVSINRAKKINTATSYRKGNGNGNGNGRLPLSILALIYTLILLAITLAPGNYLTRNNKEFGLKILLFMTGVSSALSFHLLSTQATKDNAQANKDLFSRNLTQILRGPHILINGDEVGLVEAKDGRPLPLGRHFGQYVECDNFQDSKAFFKNGGESGRQLAVLTAGLYRIDTRIFEIRKAPVVKVSQGEIALVIAQDGCPLPHGRQLGKSVECNNYQDAKAFLNNGGEKGRQLEILKTGTYHINTDLFTIVTVANSAKYGLRPEQLQLCQISSNSVGIVTTHDGAPIPRGDIAGPIIEGHSKFQDPQKFIDNGGCRGLQQELLPSGTWEVNPWFVEIEKVSLVEIPSGTVGVVNSHVGDLPAVNAEDGLVDVGYKGIQRTPLITGKYPVNTKVMSIDLVPINEIALDWRSDSNKKPSNYDFELYSLRLRSKDGFTFNIEVTQVIKVPPESAPRMISRLGSLTFDADEYSRHEVSGSLSVPKYTSIRNLVTKVLKPMVETHFHNSVQQYGALEFLDERSDRQMEALLAIREGLKVYGVQAVGTFINEVFLPNELEEVLMKQSIFRKQRITYEEELLTEQRRQMLAEQQEKIKATPALIKAQKDLEISQILAQLKLTEAEGAAQAQRLINEAELDKMRQQCQMEIYQQQQIEEQLKSLNATETAERLKALGPELYVKLESEKAWSSALANINLPEVFIEFGGASSLASSPSLQKMMVEMIRDLMSQRQGSEISSTDSNCLSSSSEVSSIPEVSDYPNDSQDSSSESHDSTGQST